MFTYSCWTRKQYSRNDFDAATGQGLIAKKQSNQKGKTVHKARAGNADGAENKAKQGMANRAWHARQT